MKRCAGGLAEGRAMKKELLDLIDVDLPPMGPIKEGDRPQIDKTKDRFRGTVRMAMGKYWTEEEQEAYRKKVLSKPLP